MPPQDKLSHVFSHEDGSVTLRLRSDIVLTGLCWGEVRSDHPPVVSLHGWLDNAASFSGLGPLLGESHHLIALDLPGHGASSHLPLASSRNFIDWVPFIDDALDALGVERVVFVSHSMGAAISLLYSGARPERVDKLVLLEGIGPMTQEAHRSLEQVRAGLDARVRFIERTTRPSRVMADVDEAVDRMLAARMPMTRRAAYVIAQRNTEVCEGGRAFSLRSYAPDPLPSAPDRGSTAPFSERDHVSLYARARLPRVAYLV